MAGSASKDMTQGSPTKLIFAFFVPLMLGMLFVLTLRQTGIQMVNGRVNKRVLMAII